jgi:L-ascorbate metabolism protein UlaG (beta-lactamase superfamily)
MQPSTTPSAVVTTPRTKVIPAQRLKDAIAIGNSTRADVISSLGETLVISFDTGYEVWVYRLAEDRRGEFVVLFAPSGVVAKTRMRR